MNRQWIATAVAFVALAAGNAATAQDAGDWVLARWKGDRYWFPGVVESRSGDRVTVAYDDGTRETLSAALVRAYDWKVGTRVSCRWQDGPDWYPGRIDAIGRDGVLLKIVYDDGDSELIDTGKCRSG